MRFSTRRPGLRAAVIAIVLVPLVTIFGAGGAIALGEIEERAERRMQEDIALVARTLRTPLARSLERRRENTLDLSLRSASRFDMVFGVYLYDADGELIAKADGSPETYPSLLAPDERPADGGDYRSIDGRELYSYFVPLTADSGRSIGMLQVTRRASDIQDYLLTLRVTVVVALVVLSALFIASVLAGYRLVIGRPLGRLGEAMQRVATGETSVRAGDSGPAEIRQLALRFNAMLQTLSERDIELSRERAEQSALEARLGEAEKYALVGRLAAGVAHELGSPLSVADGHAQRLMRSCPQGSDTHTGMARIRESTSRMGEIVRQLLGFATAASPGRQQVPVRKLVQWAVVTAGNGSSVEVAPSPPDVDVYCDEFRVREALAHLLRNACDAARGGKVVVGWAVEGGGVRVYVENAGEPIGNALRERIFEPFFTTKAPGTGSGLGLAIVKSVAADEGARLDVYESALGGAGFSLVFKR